MNVKSNTEIEDRVTVAMPVKVRDKLDDLAKDFQRKRTDKSKRITRNTVLNALIKVFLTVKFTDDDIANNERELVELFREKLKE